MLHMVISNTRSHWHNSFRPSTILWTLVGQFFYITHTYTLTQCPSSAGQQSIFLPQCLEPQPPTHPISQPSPHSIPPVLTYSSLSAFALLSHASCSLSGDSSSVMTVNSSVLPFSWIFSLFMRVTISCSLSWACELDADAAAPFPSPSLGVIIRVCCLPHQLQAHVIHLNYRIFFAIPQSAANFVKIGLLTTVHSMT